MPEHETTVLDEVARRVETADLGAMRTMDIDDVYTLMDVQLRERPDARELYRRWERQNWSAYEIDFTQDAQDWRNLPETLTGQVISLLIGFYLGEAAVTDTLSPLVHAAPTDEDRQFLSTQLVDEARHTVFFDRFFAEVVGIDGLEATRRHPDARWLLGDRERGYGKVFCVDLCEVTEAVRLDPRDYGKWLDAIVLYHMMLEGMLALQNQRALLAGARVFNVLPGFRAGFTAVTRDESRHVNYGVYALSRGVAAGHHDRIVEAATRFLDPIADVGSYTPTKVPEQASLALEQARQLLTDPAQADAIMREQTGEFPIMQLRKRLRSAGVSQDALDGLERRWWARRDANFDDYEARFGEPHPARLRRGGSN